MPTTEFNATATNLGHYNTATTWAAAHDATSATNVNFETLVGEQAITTPRINIWRYGFVFDTSSLPDNAVVSSASITANVIDKTDQINAGSYIVSFNPANPASVVAADYNDFGTTAYSDYVDTTNLTISAINTWTLNATGIAAISTSGNTLMGMRGSLDVANTNIGTGTTRYNMFRINTIKLSVTYIVPGVAMFFSQI